MSASVDRLVITRPDDWHVHLRDGPMLRAVAPATARVFARAIVMPNLRPPVTSVETAKAYRDRIRGALPADSRFEPLMTLYLTDRTTVSDVAKARESGIVHAIKYYPAGATTHSDFGVTAVKNMYPSLAAMEKHGVKKLEPQGQKFDPNLHQAMFEIPDPSVPAGTVVQIMQPGYTIGERVLRPALVGVSKGGPKAQAPAADAPANDNTENN